MPGFLKIGSKSPKNGSPSRDAATLPPVPTEAQQVAAAAGVSVQGAGPSNGQKEQQSQETQPQPQPQQQQQQQPQQQQSLPQSSSRSNSPMKGANRDIVAQLEAAAELQGWQKSAVAGPDAHGSSIRGTFPGDQQQQQQQQQPAAQSSNGTSGTNGNLPRPPFLTQEGGRGSNLPASNSLQDAIQQLNLGGRESFKPLDLSKFGGIVQPPTAQQASPEQITTEDDGEQRSRPSSFYGMDRPAADDGDYLAGTSGVPNSVPYPMTETTEGRPRDVPAAEGPRPSSFFGMEQQGGFVPGVDREGQSQAARFAAQHRVNKDVADAIPDGARSSPVSLAPSQSVSQTGAQGPGGTSTRPASIAPTTSGALLDHSHLKPGEQAALLSHNKTLELYRQNAKKTNDPDLIYEFAVFMIDAAKSMGGDDASGGSVPTGASGSSGELQGKEERAKDELVKEAITLLRKVAERGHCNAQYFLGDCYASGIGTAKGKSDYDRAYPLFVLAAKHGHPDAAYRAGMSYEKGWGCRRDLNKALQFYRKAASQSHPGALYRLGTAELNGELGLKKSAREGVKWLKRSAEAATPEFPHALHELALLHERGVDNVIYADPDYACELLAQAGEMGYAPSAYKLGVNYEYGRMGCPQDPGLSIHMYNIAAQQNHREACFALTAWYLVGAPGILPQSDTEAYLWAKKAAEQGLAKAEYSVGYFTESGIGTVRDLAEAKAWYHRASEHGDKRAHQRLAAIGGPGLANYANTKNSANKLPGMDVNGSGPGQDALTARDQGMRIAAQQRGQPSNAPFPSAVDRSLLSAGGAGTTNYPSPLVMREVQTQEREHARQMAIQHHQQQQQARLHPAMQPRNSNVGPGMGGQPYLQPGPVNASNPSIHSSLSAPPSNMPRPPLGQAGPQQSFGSQGNTFGSPPQMPNGRPMPPMQRRQPSGSDSAYQSGSSVNSHQNYMNGVFGGPPGSSNGHHLNGPGIPRRQMSNPPLPNAGSSSSWNGPGYHTYAPNGQVGPSSHSGHGVPVIRQPIPPSQQLRRGSLPNSPSYDSQPAQMHGSPMQSDDGRKKSLWAQLKAM